MKDGGARIDSEGNDADERDGDSMGATCNWEGARLRMSLPQPGSIEVNTAGLEGSKAASEPAVARSNRGELSWKGICVGSRAERIDGWRLCDFGPRT